MAYETGKFNKTPLIGNIDAASGRIIKEDNGLINVADLMAELTDQDSGVSFNVNVTIDPSPPVLNISSESNNAESKTLFSADFTGGFDTYYDWVLAFKQGVGAGIQPVSRNASSLDGNDSIGPADLTTGTLPITIDCAEITGTIYELYSNNYLKISTSGRVFSKFSGVFKNTVATTNTTTFEFRVLGQLTVEQTTWNVDTFDGSEDAGNPSGIEIDFGKLQTIVFEIHNKTQGDTRCGFLIDNIIYYAHIFKVNNELSEIEVGNLNIPVRDTVYRFPDEVTREIGLFDPSKGVSFISRMVTTNDPSLIANYELNNCVVYSTGEEEKDRRKPFSYVYDGGGGIIEYKTVSNPNSFELLLAIRPKDEIYAGVVNRTVYGIDSIELYTRSLNLDDSAIFEIYWNGVVGVPLDYVGLNNYSAIEATSVGSINFTGAIKLRTVIVNGNKNIFVSKKDLFKDYFIEFSNKIIGFAGSGTITSFPRGIFSILVKPTNGSNPIDVGATVSGFEIA